ncbi:hypothetical protein NPX13_g9664 [Xylaria arbuscula]|uniref:Uncharacterized protein n=1 Tax=Xylaria arbuscula TaxID=114810 RepID=A0A9W8TI79_9PEZI|nr:hypothetical protein NPX13_g9664 [Xylaria arbuscula]
MRLRQSNKKKQFQLPDYGLDLETSDADNDPLPRADSSGDEFVAKADDEEEEEEVQSDGNHSGDDDDDTGNDEPGQPTSRRMSAPKVVNNPNVRAKVKARANAKTTALPEQYDQFDGGQVFTEVPPYPSDPGQRWTRTYVGPIKRWTRFYELIDWWFGDKPDPYKSPERSRQQSCIRIDRDEAFGRFIPQAQGQLDVLLGHISDQKPYPIRYGQSISFSDSGQPIHDTDSGDIVTGGWLLDIGGIAVSLAWAPTQGQVDQLLAIAVIPFHDQAYYLDLKDAPKELDQKDGTIQILRFEVSRDGLGILRPSRRGPQLAQALCFSWGRVSRMQWCPVQLSAEDNTRLLGVLCVDGKLRIIGVQNITDKESNEIFEEVKEPMITLEPPRECSIEITCFTWINMNRVAAGLSDGSVMMWSLSPLRILQRHPVHSTAIIDIVSGFPTDPFLVSTVPIGGVLTVTDLTRPSSETTYHPNMMVSLQPNLLAWSPHLRGYASIWPSAFAGNPNLTFLPIRGFPVCRHLITVNGQPTCISIGACHPFLITGSTDGSVMVFNILRKLSSHREKTLKLKLFQHEYCPLSAADSEDGETMPRGVSRILHGFLPEPNSHPTGVKMAETQKRNRENGAKGKGKSTGNSVKPQAKTPKQPEGEVDEEAAMTSGPGPIVLYEPQTRITAVAWNPNVEFSWWAAAATGSGLLRVMDIGAESHTQQGEKQDDDETDVDDEDEDGYGMDAMDEDEVREEEDDVAMASGED